MSVRIFKEAAPKFWALSLKCVPLEPDSKRPAKELKSWQGHLAAVPGEANRKAWLNTYADNGIGLLMGGETKPGHILLALDVDDDRLVAPMERFLTAKGGVISGKVGKKGATFFVQMPKGSKSMVLKGTEGLGDIDVLAGGKMTVMPPSIHPETLKPYVDYGAPLLETSLDQLPAVMPNELKALGVALGSAEIFAILDGKGTHETGLPLVGRLVAKGRRTTRSRPSSPRSCRTATAATRLMSFPAGSSRRTRRASTTVAARGARALRRRSSR